MATTDHGELLTKFEEIFGSLVEHEVIKMVLQSCDWDSNSAWNMILSMIDKDQLPPHIRSAVDAEAVIRDVLTQTTEEGSSSSDLQENTPASLIENGEFIDDSFYSDDEALSPERETLVALSRESSPALSESSMATAQRMNGPVRSYSRSSTITPFAMAQGPIANEPFLSGDRPIQQRPMASGVGNGNEMPNAMTQDEGNLTDKDSDSSLPNSPYRPSAPSVEASQSVDLSQWVLAPEFVPNAYHRNRPSFAANKGFWRPIGPSARFIAESQEPNSNNLQSNGVREKTKEKTKKEEIIDRILRGDKIMVLMRGLPGSGKSSLARGIKGHSGVILSADDFFCDKHGKYKYNPNKISDAHAWNKNRARSSLREMRSPIIIDNTNLQVWEMKPYVKLALQYGYEVDILEPETAWKFSVKDLAKKNIHGVPKDKIKEMKEKYASNVRIEDIVSSLGDVSVKSGEVGDVDDIKESSPTKKTEWPDTLPNCDTVMSGEFSTGMGQETNSYFLVEGIAKLDINIGNLNAEPTAQNFIKEKPSDGCIENGLSRIQAYNTLGDLDDDADVVIEGEDDLPEISRAKAIVDDKPSNSDIILTSSPNRKILTDGITKNDDCNEKLIGNDHSHELDDISSDAPPKDESDHSLSNVPVQESMNDERKIDSGPVSASAIENLENAELILQDEENVRHLIEEAYKDIDDGSGEDWDNLVKNASEEELNEEMFNELVNNFGSSVRSELDKKQKGESATDGTPFAKDEIDYTDDAAMYEFCSNMEDKIGQSISSVISRPSGCDEATSLFSIIDPDSTGSMDAQEITKVDKLSNDSESQTTEKCEVISDKNDNVILSTCDEILDSERLVAKSGMIIDSESLVKYETSEIVSEKAESENVGESIIDSTLGQDKETDIVDPSDSREKTQVDSQKVDSAVSECPESLSMASWDCIELKNGKNVDNWDHSQDSTDEVTAGTPKPTRDGRRRIVGDPQKWLSTEEENTNSEDPDSCAWEPVAEGAVTSWEDTDQVKVPSNNNKKPMSHTGAVPKMRKNDTKQNYLGKDSGLYEDSNTLTVEDCSYIMPVLPKASVLPSIRHVDNGDVATKVVTHETETQTLSIDFQALEMDNNLYELKILYGQPDYIPATSEGMLLDNGPLTKGKLSLHKGTMTDDKPDVRAVKPLQNLVAFFPSIPESHLMDVLEKCNFDLDWAMNVLLDGGYEMADSVEVCNSPESSDNDLEGIEANNGMASEDDEIKKELNGAEGGDQVIDLHSEEKKKRLKQSQDEDTLKCKKEIEKSFMFSESVDDRVTRLTGKDFENLNITKVKHKKTKKKSSKKKHSEENGTKEAIPWEEGEGAQFVTLVMDPLFASQLMSMFGPIGSCGMSGELAPEDRNVILPLELCHQIHKYWTKTLDGKFKHETEVLDSLIREDENLARQLQEEEERASRNCVPDPESSSMDHTERIFQYDPPTNLKEIMEIEQALQASKSDRGNGNGELMSSQLSLQRLCQEYPHVDQEALKEEFKESDYNYQATVQRISSRYGSEQGIPKTVIAPEMIDHIERQMIQKAIDSEATQIADEGEDEDHTEQSFQPDNPQVYRDEAQMHYHERQKSYRKAQEAYQQGMKAVAAYYATIGKMHSEKLKEANERASQKILEAVNAKKKKDANTLDLHLLHIPEALRATQEFLSERKHLLTAKNINRMQVSLITGRGVHSEGGQARLKPAIKDFLQNSGYSYSEANSGMFTVTLLR